MKRLFPLILAFLLGNNLIAEEFTTGGIYVQVATTNLTCNFISKTTNAVDKVIVGRTYHVDADVMEVKTKAGETFNASFSNGLQVNVAPNSTFSVDAFNQSVLNLESQPAALQADYSIMSLSLLDGDAVFVSPKLPANSQIIVQTPLVNVNVAEGKLAVRSNPKYVMLNAIEGSVTVVDAKNKKNVIDKGNLGLIIPYPGRDGEIMVTQKAIAPEDLEKLSKTAAALEKSEKEVVFVVLDKKVVGVRLK